MWPMCGAAHNFRLETATANLTNLQSAVGWPAINVDCSGDNFRPTHSPEGPGYISPELPDSGETAASFRCLLLSITYLRFMLYY